MLQTTSDFNSAMGNYGLTCSEEMIIDGQIHRFHVEGDKSDSKNGWYVLYPDFPMFGAFGCWKREISQTWCSKGNVDFTSTERKLFKQRMVEVKAIQDQELIQRQAIARQRAQEIWQQSQASNSNHSYLIKKQIRAYGIKQRGDALIIPMNDIEDNLHSLQFISPAGEKRFLSRGAKKGYYHRIGEIKQKLYLCEGYATGATIHAATNQAVAVAFDAGNLLPVAQSLRIKYPTLPIIIAADNDDYGEKNTGVEKATLATQAVSATLIVPKFKNCESKPTDFNDLQLLEGIEEVKHQLNDSFSAPSLMLPAHFILQGDGLFYYESEKSDTPLFIASPLQVTALVRDGSSENWGRLLEFNDADGKPHTWAMPMEMLKGSGEELRGELLRLGLHIAPGTKARNLLLQYIISSTPKARVRCVKRIGWHEGLYVLPHTTIGHHTNERIVYQAEQSVKAFKQLGTLNDWQQQIATLCRGNSRLIVAISAAFAAKLLYLGNFESGGLHFVGESSTGKTTALRVAASVNSAPDGLYRWRATANGLESLAALHCDSLLILDELAQVEPKEAGEIAYMLANGAGKTRANRLGIARAHCEWRLLFLSAGEIGLAQHMNAADKKMRAGQEVRLVDIPADAGCNLGLFETLHNFASAAELSKQLIEASQHFYGTPIIAFLQQITHPNTFKQLPALLKQLSKEFLEENLSPGASGQASRVCERFALIAASGEIATHYGITGWDRGEAEHAAFQCFKAWLEQRGGSGQHEEKQILSQVKNFFEQYGNARFTDWDNPNELTTMRAGFKKRQPDLTVWYYVLPEAFRYQMCMEMEPRHVIKTLVKVGWLLLDSDGKPQRRESLPGLGRTRCYVFNTKVWEES